MKRSIACIALTLLPLFAAAQDRSSDDYVEYRQAAYKVMSWHFKKMGAMIQGRNPYDATEFKKRAEAVSALSKLPAEGFLPQTQSTELPTRLKPEMWYQKERFDTYMQDLIKATTDLAAQAGAKDKDDLRAVYGKAARACKNCHDRFRESN